MVGVTAKQSGKPDYRRSADDRVTYSRHVSVIDKLTNIWPILISDWDHNHIVATWVHTRFKRCCLEVIRDDLHKTCEHCVSHAEIQQLHDTLSSWY